MVIIGATEPERGSMTSGTTEACPSCDAVGPLAWAAAMSLSIARAVESGGSPSDAQPASAAAATKHKPAIPSRMVTSIPMARCVAYTMQVGSDCGADMNQGVEIAEARRDAAATRICHESGPCV